MNRLLRYWITRGLIFLTPLALLSACGGQQRIPRVVNVPIPVPCDIIQAEVSELPEPPTGADIFVLAQHAAAQIKLLKADRERLLAANRSPCVGKSE